MVEIRVLLRQTRCTVSRGPRRGEDHSVTGEIRRADASGLDKGEPGKGPQTCW